MARARTPTTRMHAPPITADTSAVLRGVVASPVPLI